MKHLGPIFRLHRKEKGYSMEQVSGLVPLNTSKISDFEIMKTKVTEKKLILMYEKLGIKFIYNEQDIMKFSQLFDEFYNNILDCESHEHVYSILKSKKEQIQCTEAYILYLLVELIHAVYTHDSYFEYVKVQKNIEINLDYLTTNQKQIFYDTVGVYYKNKLKYDIAMDYLSKGEILSSNKPILAMIYYHQAMIFMDLMNMFEAIEKIKKAQMSFANHLLIKRQIICSSTFAAILTHQGHYEQADKIKCQCIKQFKLLDMKNDLRICYNNLLWNYLLWGKYEMLITSGIEILDEVKNIPSLYFYMSYAYEKLGNREKSIDFINYAKTSSNKNNCSPYMKSIIDTYFILLTNEDLKVKEENLLKTYKIAKKRHDYQLELFVLNMLCEISIDAKYVSKQNKYLKEIIRIYKRNNN